MNKISITISSLFFAFTSLHAQGVQSPLEAGNYLLVYQTDQNLGMRSLKVSFTKGADGTFMLSCSDASYLPTTVTQAQSTFQFGLINPGHRDEVRGTEQPFEALYFVGHPKVIFTEQHDYKQEAGVCTGTAASIAAAILPQGGVNRAASGTFLLSKLPQ